MLWKRTTGALAVLPGPGPARVDEAQQLRQRVAELEAKVSELCRAEQSAAESRSQYRALFEASLDAVITLDRQGCITSANQAAATISGYTRTELVGMRLAQLCAPECLTSSLQAFNQALLGAPRRTETTFRTKDGRLIDAVASGSPLLQGGEVAGVLVVLCQTHERQPAGPALRFTETEWQATFDAVSEGVCLASATGWILRANQALAQTAGRSLDQLLGRPFTEIFPEFAAPDPYGPLQRLRHSRQRETFETQRQGRWYRLECVPISSSQGELVGAVLQLSDISAHRALEDHLRRLQQQINT